MITNMVFDKSGVPLLQRFLNLSSLRQKLISGNIANVSTPGYQSKDIDFHGELNKAVKNKGGLKVVATHPNHIPVGKTPQSGPEVTVDKTGESNGINNVNIDEEIANQAQNQIYYSIGARLLSLKFQGIRKAIQSN